MKCGIFSLDAKSTYSTAQSTYQIPRGKKWDKIEIESNHKPWEKEVSYCNLLLQPEDVLFDAQRRRRAHLLVSISKVPVSIQLCYRNEQKVLFGTIYIIYTNVQDKARIISVMGCCSV